ncbi:MAG: hypothetical protein CFE32_05815 [Alphaproteobacteria bacterium PA3]|nr:MAG: hypothetical protein CFE32_05815 [Alphaproteobacteria bacterium PA3]
MTIAFWGCDLSQVLDCLKADFRRLRQRALAGGSHPICTVVNYRIYAAIVGFWACVKQQILMFGWSS